MKNFILTACAALLAAGCQNSVNSVENQQKHGVGNYIADHRVITDSFLKDRLQITGVNTGVNAGGIMTVQVTAVNVRTGAFAQMWSGMTGENPYPVNYRFVWFDEYGIEVETNLSVWQRITIRPGETVNFRGVAPGPNVRDFRIDIVEAE
jgi:uncharacterized protein YcfL